MVTLGRNDPSTRDSNAAVMIGGCSGTLVGASLVVTAGHCVTLTTHARIRIGDWVDMASDQTVFFGNDRQNFGLTRTATQFNYPGFDDIAIVKLDEPVNPTDVLPAIVLTRIPNGEEPVSFLRDKNFRMVGWGPTTPNGPTPRFRQRASATFGAFPYQPFGVVQPNMLMARGVGGATALPGDSGSPLFYDCHNLILGSASSQNFLVGVCQGTESGGGRYLVPFGEGGVDSVGMSKPSLRTWFERVLYHEILPRGVMPMLSWWNPDTIDNFATTKPSWTMNFPTSIIWQPGCTAIFNKTLDSGERVHQKGDYFAYRLEGYVFDPKEPQPPNTVPLFSWWSQEWLDNRLTSNPFLIMDPADVAWNGEEISNGPFTRGYKMYRLEGYVFDPSQPQPPDTIPLFEWWNATDHDTFTTSDPKWSIPLSEINVGLPGSPDQRIPNRDRFERRNYKPNRLAGYIYRPLLY